MDGYPPLIRFVSYEEGELAPVGDDEIARYGCVPNVGDVLNDPLLDDMPPRIVLRRYFIPKLNESDVWYLIVEDAPPDSEAELVFAVDRVVSEEIKKIRAEKHQKVQEDIRLLLGPPTACDSRILGILQWLSSHGGARSHKQIERAGPKTVDEMLRQGFVEKVGETKRGLALVKIAPEGEKQLKIAEEWRRKKEERGR